MPKVHYVKRKLPKQHGLEYVNRIFELERKRRKKSKGGARMQERAVVKSPKNAIVMNGFVGKNDNTEMNGMGMETNKIQEGLERWNVGEQCGAANENDHGTQ